MSLKQVGEREDVFARHYKYDEAEVIVADFGATEEEASVDILEDTAIVVFEDEDSRQLELELPKGEAEAFMTNGVLTITVNQ
ncbi:DUF7127 family protein [Halorussus halophilus]|uniref:DUF7127 family protein n=1 Tax=Halorussus halophilus TaxID=2650975 RepID=UPI00130102C5|nr:hypothetical protein [Halorussus halophilus]